MDGECGGPLVLISHPNGSYAEISPLGATVLRWINSQGTDCLFRPPGSSMTPADPEWRGGVVPCFPQAGTAGPLPSGGFARTLNWEVLGTSTSPGKALDPAPTVTLRTQDNPETRKVWDHAFEMEVQVSLMETDDFPEVQRWTPGGVETLPASHPVRVAVQGAVEEAEEVRRESKAKKVSACVMCVYV